MIRSLTYRLLLGASVSSAIVLGLLGFSVYASMRHTLFAEFDDQLRFEARLLTTMVDVNDGRIGFDFRSHQLPGFDHPKHERYFQIWRQDGSLMARSPSLRNDQFERPATQPSIPIQMEYPSGTGVRAISTNYYPRQWRRDERRSSRYVQIVVAASTREVEHTLQQLGLKLTILSAAAVAIMGAVLLRVVNRGIRPVKALAQQIESVRETDLDRRLPQDGVPTELVPMVDKLNGLLERLEGAFAREKAFTADVAHELRTPLTGLRMTLEVCRSRSREPAAYEAALDECRGITDRMEAMMESLLLLTRSDAGQLTTAREPVEICELIHEAWSQVEYRAQRSNVHVEFDTHEPLTIQTDLEKLSIVLRNVLENAVSYVDEGGRIRIGVRRDNDRAIVEIANSGSQIPTEDAKHLFERFWRGDASRTDAGTHCGLGLSICHRLMKLLDGEITVETSQGGDFIVRLSLRSPEPSISGPGPTDASDRSAEPA